MCWDGSVNDFVEAVLERLSSAPPSSRQIVAIAGPPAAGKSTLAAELADRLGPSAGIVGLDAFHFDDAVLDERGDRSRKGAPHTFDWPGYRALIERVRDDADGDIAIPVFDRSLELTRNGAAILSSEVTTVITEGNWLLLDRPGWRDLRDLFDLTVMLQVEESVVESRILARWTGLGFDAPTAQKRAWSNDIPNARMVARESLAADLTLS